MKYYYQPENRIIETEELVRKYGSGLPITQLGCLELTIQPGYMSLLGLTPLETSGIPLNPMRICNLKLSLLWWLLD